MRLKKLDDVLKGQPLPDVIRIMMYRPAFFGQQFSDTLHELLQGSSDWSSGERELFAAFVSSKNKCRFWTDSHGAVASYTLGEEVVNAALSDWRTAPISGNLRLMLGFLEKLTLHPKEIKPFDVQLLREADMSKQAIEDAIYICAFFNIIDRVADALNFNVPSPEVFAHRAEVTAMRGYRFTPTQK